MPYFYDKAHYQAVAHLLVAGDIASRVVSNDAFMGVEVKLDDGTVVVWGNSGKVWASSLIKPGGDLCTEYSDMPTDSDPEAVATMIATWPYEAAPVPTT